MTEKIITGVEISTRDISSEGETRQLNITGDEGAIFSIEIYSAGDGTPLYYDFMTKSWVTYKTGLTKVKLEQKSYSINITFDAWSTNNPPFTLSVIAETHGDIITRHTGYVEYYNADGTVNINASTGSNSNIVKRIIYQYDMINLYLSIIAPSRYTPNTSTVNGAVSSSNRIVIDGDATDIKILDIGDKVTGGDIASSSNVLVTKVNPDNDNVNEIEVNQTTSVEDGVSLSFSPPFRSMTPHYTDSTTGRHAMEANSGGSIKSSFTITCTAGSGRPFSNPNAPTIDDLCVVKTVNIGSAALPIEGENVSSSTYYRWPVSNIVGLSDGMVLDPTRTSNTVIDSRIGGYLAEKSTNEIIEREYYNDVKTITVNDINVDGVSASSNSVTAIDVYGAATAQEGNVTFDVQQPDALKSDTNVKLIGYGVDQIRTVTGANVELSNVTIELTQISTTTTSRTINSTTIPVAEVGGIGADATIRGIGINSTVALPTVTFKNVATGAGNLTASAAQSLESGATLFFDGTGTVATIKGDIKISNVPTSDTTFYFDIERFLDAL